MMTICRTYFEQLIYDIAENVHNTLLIILSSPLRKYVYMCLISLQLD